MSRSKYCTSYQWEHYERVKKTELIEGEELWTVAHMPQHGREWVPQAPNRILALSSAQNASK